MDAMIAVLGVPLLDVLQDPNLDLRCLGVLWNTADDLDGNISLVPIIETLDNFGKCALAHEFDDLEPLGDIVPNTEDVVTLFVIMTVLGCALALLPGPCTGIGTVAAAADAITIAMAMARVLSITISVTIVVVAITLAFAVVISTIMRSTTGAML